MRDRPQDDDGPATSSPAAVSGPDADSTIPAMPSDGQVVLSLGDAGYAKRQVIDGLDPNLAAMLAAARDWGGRVHDLRRQKP